MQNLLRFSAHSFHFPVNCTSRLITLLRQVDEKYVFKLHALELINIDIKQNGRNVQNIERLADKLSFWVSLVILNLPIPL